MIESEYYEQAVAIADLFDYDLQLIDQVEGSLLVIGGKNDSVTPVRIAHDTSLDRSTVSNLFRQLETLNIVSRENYSKTVAESPYRIETYAVRELFTTTRTAVNIIDAYRNRQPPQTDATPLVTFPDDPSFEDVTPTKFGMNQLLSALASQIKNAEDSIVILSPFFEGTGFERLHSVLADAIERGVEVTIVTRYLRDRSSHNYEVLSEFIEYVREERNLVKGVRLFDYTVWDEDVPAPKRRQDGVNPAFTLHAKVMLFDETTAYIGSANVTDYGFDRYLELGVLLEGSSVKRYHDLCEHLLNSRGVTETQL